MDELHERLKSAKKLKPKYKYVETALPGPPCSQCVLRVSYWCTCAHVLAHMVLKYGYKGNFVMVPCSAAKENEIPCGGPYVYGSKLLWATPWDTKTGANVAEHDPDRFEKKEDDSVGG